MLREEEAVDRAERRQMRWVAEPAAELVAALVAEPGRRQVERS